MIVMEFGDWRNPIMTYLGGYKLSKIVIQGQLWNARVLQLMLIMR